MVFKGILKSSPYSTLSALGGAGPSIAWGGQFDPHFLPAPRGLLLIIILDKWLSKKDWVNILKIGRIITIFVEQDIFVKNFEKFIFQTWNHRDSAIS